MVGDRSSGYTAGLEAKYAISNGFEIAAQVGYVEAINPTLGYYMFQGPSARLAAQFDVTNSLSVIIDAEYAYTDDCFEACAGTSPGNWGEYKSAGIEIAYTFYNGYQALLGYESQYIESADGDHATADNLFVGLRIPFGGGNGQNLLSTPMGGFNAAGWMVGLD